MAATLIVKITLGTEIRRFTASNATLTWSALTKKVVELFELSAKTFKLTYVDDEQDRITLSTESELADAVGLALSTSPAVLRLTVHVEAEKKNYSTQADVAMSDAATDARVPAANTADAATHARPSTADAGNAAGNPTQNQPNHADANYAAFLNNLARQLPALVGRLPEGVRNLIPNAELDVAATLAANAVDNASMAAADAARAAHAAFAGASPHQAPRGCARGECKYAATWHRSHCCNACKDGKDHHGPRCEKVELEPAAPAHSDAAMVVERLGESEADPAAQVHLGVTCDKSGQCPIVGNRYNLVGHNYDLCEAEWNKLGEKEQALYHKVPPPFVARVAAAEEARARDALGHPGVECDRSGMCPIIGTRYNLRGHNYDLCQAEWEKLPATEKLLYTPIPPPSVFPPPAAAAAGGNWPRASGSWGGQFAHAWGGGGRGGWGPRGGHHGGHHGEDGRGGPKLAARFVRDVSIFDGTQMAPSTQFTKIWRLKNIGEVPWPAGTRVLYVGGDQMATEASVPLSRAGPVFPGEEVDVAVEMAAPSELGRYLGYWRLVGPHGRRKFGQRVWCHVQVVDPAAPVDVLASSEDNLRRVLQEIEQKKSALAATEPDADPADEEPEKELEKEGAAGGPPPSLAPPAPPADPISAAAAVAVTSSPSGGVCVNICTVGGAPPPSPAPEAAAGGAAAEAVLVGLPVRPDEPKEAADASDGSDDGFVLTEHDVLLGVEQAEHEAAAGPSEKKPSPDGVRAALGAMGFTDAALVAVVMAKHGADLDACARDLAAATEWDSLLDDLAEMGFSNRDLNKTLMLKHDGNVKRTVKALVEDA